MARGIAGAPADQGRCHRVRQQDRAHGLGDDDEGRALQGTRRTCGVKRSGRNIRRDVNSSRLPGRTSVPRTPVEIAAEIPRIHQIDRVALLLRQSEETLGPRGCRASPQRQCRDSCIEEAHMLACLSDGLHRRGFHDPARAQGADVDDGNFAEIRPPTDLQHRPLPAFGAPTTG
jgi:hypothetical protein